MLRPTSPPLEPSPRDVSFYTEAIHILVNVGVAEEEEKEQQQQPAAPAAQRQYAATGAASDDPGDNAAAAANAEQTELATTIRKQIHSPKPPTRKPKPQPNNPKPKT